MVESITPRDLYDGIAAGTIPMILDVRNQEEYATWVVEGPRSVPMRNVPIWLAVEQVEELVREIPDGTVVVCAHGNGSALLLEMLEEEGRITRNLEGGTAAWSELLVPRRLRNLPEGLVGWQVLRPAKACISYLIGAPGGSCIVVDPARFPDSYIRLAESEGMSIAHVMDTHVHADHISGGIELAQKVGCPYHVPMEDTGRDAPIPNVPLADGTVLEIGDHRLEAIAITMPGHTPGSQCLHIPGHLILTGDTVFVRGLGRPDLTGKAEELARELFHTVHDRLKPLDPATAVLPAHWTLADEFDSEGLVRTTLGTIFESSLLSEADLADFIAEILTSLPSAPETYDRIRLVNSGHVADLEEIEFLEIGKNQCAATTTLRDA